MRHARLLLAVLALAGLAAAAEVVWLDGTRESVARVVVKDDRLLLSFEKGMRSVALRRVVAVRGDDDQPVALDRTLRDGPLETEAAAALAALPTADPVALHALQERLADTMRRVVMTRLAELAKDGKADLRARAGETLLLMGLAEPLGAGLDLALKDRDDGVRKRLATGLFAVLGALRTEGLADKVAEGLADRSVDVRTTLALVLGRLGDARAVDVLKASGIKHRDHHVRESAAEVLGELGDDAGVSVLIGMLTRTRHPAGPDLPEHLVIEEKVRVCDLLGKLKAKAAVSALKKATRAKQPDLAAAARRALAAIGS